MSIKRYHLYAGLDVHAFSKCEAVLKYCVEDEGVWVMYEDYARLKTEVERLTVERNGFQQAMKANQSILETKRDVIERLRKAGDAVCESPYLWETDPAVLEWQAAKEGKPSA